VYFSTVNQGAKDMGHDSGTVLGQSAVCWELHKK